MFSKNMKDHKKIKDLIKEINSLANPKQAKLLQCYFKTGKGEYGEGDIFLGLKVPQDRTLAKKYLNLNLDAVVKLLAAKIHEYRQIALLILVLKFKKADSEEKKNIYDLYLKNTKFINNWDLVDSSSPIIIGGYLINKNRKILYKLAKSKNLWERRIAVLATFAFIKQNDFSDSFTIAGLLLSDTHDLIHKAVGWMLREIGKRDQKKEEEFLKNHNGKMSRTTLRYAIEKFPQELRQKYLHTKTESRI